MDECCIYYNQANEQKLFLLSSYKSLQTLLVEAKLREDKKIVDAAEETVYHPMCYNLSIYLMSIYLMF